MRRIATDSFWVPGDLVADARQMVPLRAAVIKLDAVRTAVGTHSDSHCERELVRVSAATM